MELPVNPSQLVDLLRAWFFAKDRSIVLASDTFAEFPEISTPSNPVAGRHRLYPKSDTYWYELGDTEGLLAGWNLISETVLSASVASVTFSNIPDVFRSLMLIAETRSDQAAELETGIMRFNGDAGNNYDYSQVQNGAFNVTRATTFIVSGFGEAANSRASCFSPLVVIIPGYSRNDGEKFAYSYSGAFGDLSADADLFFFTCYGHWRNTNIISSIELSPITGPNYVSGSKFQLYGIK